MRRVGILVAGLLWAFGLSPIVSPFVSPAHAAVGCGALDRPETGIRGEVPLADQLSGRADQGYNCGVSLVGYNSLGGRGGNANMAWSGQCAYIAGNGVAVVDVHDPTNPRLVQTLHGPGSNASSETITALDVGDRHLLVAGKYGIGGTSGEPGHGPVDIYDTTDCAHPALLSHFKFPTNVHNLTISADGKRLYSTLPLQAADITDPRHPNMLGDLDRGLRDAGDIHSQNAHEALPSPDGTRLYIGNQQAQEEEMLIVDIRDWPHRQPRIVGHTTLPGHSIRRMTINGKPYLLNSDESVVSPTAKGCAPQQLTPFGGAAQPYITDISNERRPHAVSQFQLPINDPLNCPQAIADQTDSSVHYHDVDDPNHTTFALLSMWNAGMRIVDVRNPRQPREVAYFNPGRISHSLPTPNLDNPGAGTALGLLAATAGLDQAWAHIRYQPSTGLIWLATKSGGFWVLELEPQVRALLGLPALASHNPRGSIPRPPATRVAVASNASPAEMYCTVAPVYAKV